MVISFSSPRSFSRMNESGELWTLYQSTQRRMGSTPIASTPKTPNKNTMRPPETPNVTNIGLENDENLDTIEDTNNLLIRFMKKCESLKTENSNLKDIVNKQAATIKELTALVKSMNSTSEMESSESHEKSTSLSLSKSAKVQRVTPTKRETSSSSSCVSTPAESSTTPRVRSSMQRASRRPTPVNIVTETRNTPIQRQRVFPPVTPNIISTPILPQSQPQVRTTTSTIRRSQPRRRLFEVEQHHEALHRSHSEPAIEHLNISPMKDDAWGRACPPRLHLERNRPEFIERLEARQRIIKAAAERRAEIEHRKRIAARAVATGQRSAESVSRDLFADSTTVRAFYEKDMREITLRNIRNSDQYRSRVWQRMAKVDQAANRIIAQTHTLRTRSTSRTRRRSNA